jgi:DNA-binding response OmpR family regulator
MANRILLVEDDFYTREALALNLARAGYEITQADDGQQAIGLLTTEGAEGSPQVHYDVVLSDIVMGEVDGIEVMHTARRQPDAPEVILLTGHGSLETAIAAVNAGAFSYLLKPVQIAEVLERVAAAVQYHDQKRHHTQQAQGFQKIADVIQRLQDASSQPAAAPPAPNAAASAGPPASDPAQADTSTAPDRYLQVGELRIDTYRHEVWFGEESLHLTPTEYTIVTCLAAQPGRVMSYGAMAQHTHGPNIDESEAHELLRFHIRNLRRKIDRRYLVSVRGVGCLLDVPAAETHEGDEADD